VGNETGPTGKESRAEQYELVGRIAGGIVHDLNNTLSTVTTFADLLLARADPGSPAAEDLSEIKEAGVAAAATVRRLQLFARPGRHPAEDVDVAEVLQSIESLLARLLAPSIALEIAIEDGAPPVHAPRSRIEEVLVALAGATLTSAPAGGALRIRAGAGPPLAGTGQPSAMIEGAASGLDGSGGVGRDPLALTRSLVSELGGRLETEATSYGSGVVRIVLAGVAEQR